jgi:hypothetical protein
MAVSPRRRRPKDSLAALKRGLFSVFLHNVEFVEDEGQEMSARLQASTAAVQAGLAYSRVVEQHDMAAEMADLQRLAHGNGHAT